MSAGDFVRRAVGNVSNTIAQTSSTVTSVAQGRKRYDISDSAIEKCTLTIKCTPNKDAQTTTALSIKSGYLMKRNEQGQWRKRYICTVPHLFLYYFDSDSADSPRGVIDLELYTNITQHKNTLKAATSNEEKMRAFHFMSQDSTQLNDWLANFMRDRYFAVCEERNAYQQMQSEMTAVLDTISCQTKVVEMDKEIVEKQLQDALLAKQEAMRVLQNMLVIVGITDEEMSNLSDLNRIGHFLQTAIIRLKTEVEMKFYGRDEVLEVEKAARAEEVQELHEKIEMEIRARKNLEAMLLKQKKTAELQNAEADEKIASLTEQRRLLIKEVKRARGKLTETEHSLEQVESVNAKLTSALNALQTELAAVKRALVEQEQKQTCVALEESEWRHQTAVSAAVVATQDAVRVPSSQRRGESAEQTSEVDVVGGDGQSLFLPAPNTFFAESACSDAPDTPSSTPENITEASETSFGATQGPQSAFISPREVELLLLESQAVTSKLQPGTNTSNPERLTSNGSASGAATPTGSLFNANLETNLALSAPDNGLDVTPQTPMNLKELGWLSPEQEKLIDSRIQLQQQQHSVVEAQYKYLDSSAEEGRAASIAASSASAAASSTFSLFSGAMSMLSSTATTTPHSATGHDDSTPATNNSQKRASKGFISSLFQSEKNSTAAESAEKDNQQGPSEEEDPERLPSAMRLNCLRCAGTVEGPKHSTCKCSVPALVPEDLQPASSSASSSSSSSSTGSWGFSMLSKSSSAFVGSLMKTAKAAAPVPASSVPSDTATSADSGATSAAGKDTMKEKGEYNINKTDRAEREDISVAEDVIESSESAEKGENLTLPDENKHNLKSAEHNSDTIQSIRPTDTPEETTEESVREGEGKGEIASVVEEKVHM